MKCQQALGREISASDSDEGEGEETKFLLCKTKKHKLHFHNPPVPTRMQNPGYYQQSVNPVYQSQFYGGGHYNPQEQQPGPVGPHQHGEAFA